MFEKKTIPLGIFEKFEKHSFFKQFKLFIGVGISIFKFWMFRFKQFRIFVGVWIWFQIQKIMEMVLDYSNNKNGVALFK